MRKLAIVMAFASTALATTAQARDGAWYVGVEGGGMIVEDSDFDLGATSNAVTVEHEKGFDVDGIIGYDFSGFRAEFEVGYKRSEEHTSELQSLMRISYAVFCLKKKNN